MLSTIIGFILLAVSLVGIGFLFFFFLKAVAEEFAYNKWSKELRRQI